MKTFEVQWTRCPTRYNPTNLLYVEAANTKDAETLAKDHIKRVFGIGDWIQVIANEYVPPPASMGRVLSHKKGETE